MSQSVSQSVSQLDSQSDRQTIKQTGRQTISGVAPQIEGEHLSFVSALEKELGPQRGVAEGLARCDATHGERGGR